MKNLIELISTIIDKFGGMGALTLLMVVVFSSLTFERCTSHFELKKYNNIIAVVSEIRKMEVIEDKTIEPILNNTIIRMEVLMGEVDTERPVNSRCLSALITSVMMLIIGVIVIIVSRYKDDPVQHGETRNVIIGISILAIIVGIIGGFVPPMHYSTSVQYFWIPLTINILALVAMVGIFNRIRQSKPDSP